MQYSLTRKQLLKLGVGTVGAAALGCGDGDGGGGGGAGGADEGGTGGAGGNMSAQGGSGQGGAGGANEGGSTGAGGSMNEGGSGGSTAQGGSGGSTAQGGSGGSTAQGGSGGSTAQGGSGGSTAQGGSGGSTAQGGSGGNNMASMCRGMITARISLNHGHSLQIPLADIMAGQTRCYNARGSSTHDHWLIVTAEHFAMLRNGEVVRLVSCNGGDHEYVLSCNSSAPDPVDPMCRENDNRGAMSCR